VSAALPALVERAFERLGFAKKPAADRAGLDALYAAWCHAVPFDNVRKRIALARGWSEPLPGGRPADLLAAWLEHGTSGTCWPSSNGLHAMVDSSILCGAPIRLDRSRASDNGDPVHPIRVEPASGGLLVHWGMTQSAQTIPCRLMQDPVDEAFYLERYEISRGYSVFNDALYARKNFPGRLVSFTGRVRHEKTAEGVTSRELSLPELRAALVEELGYSAAIVDELERSAGFR